MIYGFARLENDTLERYRIIEKSHPILRSLASLCGENGVVESTKELM